MRRPSFFACAGLSALPLVALLSTTLPAQTPDVLGIWFDAAATVDTVTAVAPGQVVTAYLVLLDPSSPSGVAGWECAIELDGVGVSDLGWETVGGLNIDAPPRFQVGFTLDDQLPSAPVVVLATARFLVTAPDATARLFIHPYAPASLQEPTRSGYFRQVPVYACVHDPGDLRYLEWSSGSEALPVAVINPVAAGPEARAFPAHLPLGFVAVGQAREQAYDIANVGDGRLEGVVPEPTGAGFSLLEGGGAFALGPGEVRRVNVGFAPLAPGGVDESLAVGGGVRLTGAGFVPGLCEMSPPVLDFGTVVVGLERCLLLRIGNRDTTPLAVRLSLPAGPFALPDGGDFFLPAGEEIPISVCFAPVDTGAAEVVLEVGGGCGSVICRAAGVLGPPVCVQSNGVLDFGSAVVGDVLVRSTTLTNREGGLLTGLVSLPDSLPFTLLEGAGPYTLAAGESHTITVRYAPTAIGNDTRLLDTGSTACGRILMQAGVPGCAVRPVALDFGSTTAGATVYRQFQVTNTGGGQLALPQTLVAGPFHLSCARLVAAGQTVTGSVSFAPEILGEWVTEIDLGTTCGPLVCTGACAGPAPGCRLTPASLVFSPLVLGYSSTLAFDILNSGNTSFTGTVASSSAEFRVTAGGGWYQLSAGATRHVKVTFAPGAAGLRTGVIRTGTTLCGDLPCSGTGIGTSCSLSTDTLDFGGVAQGAAAQRSFTITCVGAGPVEGTVPPGEDNFQVISGAGPFQLYEGQTRQVTMRFAPGAPGPYAAALALGTACGGVQCLGTGLQGEPVCTVAPDALAFGTVGLGRQREIGFTVRNAAFDTLRGEPRLEGAGFALVAGDGPFSLAAGETRGVTVRFAPTAAQAYGGTVFLDGTGCAVGLAGAGGSPDADLVGLWFDTGGSVDTLQTTAPFTPVTAHLLLLQPSEPSGVSGWEGCVEIRGDVAQAGWTLAGQALNIGSPPCFQVGLTGAALPWAPAVALASVTFMQASPDSETLLFVHPYTFPSVPGAPVYAAGDDPGRLVCMGWAAGDEAIPAAVVNPQAWQAFTAPAPAVVCDGLTAVLTWTPAAGATDLYHLFRQVDGGPVRQLTTAPLAALGGVVTYTDEVGGIAAGSVLGYHYRVLRGGRELGTSGTAAITRTTAASSATALRSIAPNPFNPSTTVRFELARPGHARVVVYDVAGRRIRVLCDEALPAGPHARAWDGLDDRGQTVPSGAYYVRLDAGKVVELRKMALVR